MIHELVRDAVSSAPALLAVIGFPPEEKPDPASVAGTIVDLDTADPGVPLGTSGSTVVAARTYTDLRRAASMAGVLPKTTHLVLAVARPVAERGFALPAAHPDWRLISVQARQGTAGSWAIEARFQHARPAGEFLTALVRGIDGHGLPAVPAARVALAGAGAAHWRPGGAGVMLTTMGGPLGDPAGPPPADIVIRSVGPEPGPWNDPRVTVIDRPRADRLSWANLEAGEPGPAVTVPSEADAVPPIDERSVNPVGFRSDPEHGNAVLTQTGDRWSIAVDPANDPADIVRFHPSGVVTDADVARLRRLRSITIDWGRHTGPIAAIRVVAGLAAAGVPLRTAHVPTWAGALGSELGDLITAVKDDDLADDLRREEHSVRLRRAALGTHSVQARWRNLATTAGLAVPGRPKVSVILCTRRPEFVGFALQQIARQRHVDLEVILTLHGVDADLPEVRAAVAGFARPITVVEASAAVPFGVALNQGAARASGRYVAKWDDDDWYGPDFLADMLMASAYTGAELVGCMAQFVYLGQIDLTIYRAMRSEWSTRLISGGTFVLERSAFDAVGGFPPVPRSVDAAMLDALCAVGARIYRTHSLGYVLHRRATGHTWSQPVTYFLRKAASQWRGLRFSALFAPDDPPLDLRRPASETK